jgi:hypothetical protein
VIKRGKPATVVYRYHFRLIEVSDRVSEVIERHLHTHHRRVSLEESHPESAGAAADGAAAGSGAATGGAAGAGTGAKPKAATPVVTPPSDPHHAEALYQIDADEVSALLNSLVVDMGLDRAYNMFVLVPHRYACAPCRH